MSSADLVLIVHFCYVVFVVGSLPVIWLGAWLKCTFVRNRWFRYLHLAAILWVVAESLLGVVCPLTAWENSLRQIETNHSFIQQWLTLTRCVSLSFPPPPLLLLREIHIS
jgi:hypothetical protein